VIIGLVSEILPVPGFLLATLVFPPSNWFDGIFFAKLAFALVVNFVVFAGGSYFWLKQWNR